MYSWFADSLSHKSLWLSTCIDRPCLIPEMYEMYVFTGSRLRCNTYTDMPCWFYLVYKVFTRHLNMECFESAVLQLSYLMCPLTFWAFCLIAFNFSRIDWVKWFHWSRRKHGYNKCGKNGLLGSDKSKISLPILDGSVV